MLKQDRTAGNGRESQKQGWNGTEVESAKLPFSEFLPPLLTSMVENQFAYSRREKEELARWPIFESVGARAVQAPVFEEHGKPMATPRPTVRPLRLRRLLGWLG